MGRRETRDMTCLSNPDHAFSQDRLCRVTP